MAKKKVKKSVAKKTKKKPVAKKAKSLAKVKVSKKKVVKKAAKKSASKKTTKKTTKKITKKKVVKKQSKKTLNKKKPVKKTTKATKVVKKNSKKSSKSKSISPQSKESQIPFEMESWPKDRDVLWNPDRHKYLTSAKPEGCVFCAAANFGVSKESLVLFKNHNTMVVLNKYPYHTAHVMVMPVKHVGELEKLEDQEYIDIQNLIRKTAKILKKVYKCEGLNIGINLGSAAGAGIPGHLHYHILPRWTADHNFFPLIAKTKVISESLETTYNKLKPHFLEQKENSPSPGSNDWKQVEFALDLV